MHFQIQSETDRLEAVIVHTPGREVSLVNPEIREELLFDDIVYEEDARAEHVDMLSIFRAALPENGRVFEILDLASEALQQEGAKEWFVEGLISIVPEENLHLIRNKLIQIHKTELLQFVVEGLSPHDIPFNLPPSPNLLFTRDLGAVIGNRIILTRMAQSARKREALIMELIVTFHPFFETLQGHVIQIPEGHSIEGGDILMALPDTVLIGMSERTTFGGLMSVANQLLYGKIKHVVAVDIPKKRSSMHLDTIFTFADKTECVVFNPVINSSSSQVVLLTRSGGEESAEKIQLDVMPGLKKALEEISGESFTFIPCGGKELTNQFREQWTDGANLFALAPGVVVGYERNTHTFSEMAEHGYRLMNQFEFIEEFTQKKFDPTQEGKLAISFQGHELCRGRGGARCMTLPLRRSAHA